MESLQAQHSPYFLAGKAYPTQFIQFCAQPHGNTHIWRVTSGTQMSGFLLKRYTTIFYILRILPFQNRTSKRYERAETFFAVTYCIRHETMVIKTQDGCSLATFKTTLTPPTMPPPQQVISVDKHQQPLLFGSATGTCIEPDTTITLTPEKYCYSCQILTTRTQVCH